MIKTSDLYETKTVTVSESKDSITFSHYIRPKGTEVWSYCGTVTNYADGSSELEDNDICY